MPPRKTGSVYPPGTFFHYLFKIIDEEHGMADSALDKKAGYSIGTVSRLRQGVHIPHMQTIIDILEVLDLHLVAEPGSKHPKKYTSKVQMPETEPDM